MTVKQLKQNIDIQINSELKRITGSELKAALLKTSKSAKTDELTWIDITQDRDIWRMVVLNSFDVKSMMHRKTFESRRDYNITINGVTRNAYEKIHEDIPRRPKTTKKSRLNKLPKLYAVWMGASKPEGRKKMIKRIYDSWLETKPKVFKVSGAEYMAATNNAAGRKHLEYWLQNHFEHHLGNNIHCRRDGKYYRPKPKV